MTCYIFEAMIEAYNLGVLTLSHSLMGIFSCTCRCSPLRYCWRWLKCFGRRAKKAGSQGTAHPPVLRNTHEFFKVFLLPTCQPQIVCVYLCLMFMLTSVMVVATLSSFPSLKSPRVPFNCYLVLPALTCGIALSRLRGYRWKRLERQLEQVPRGRVSNLFCTHPDKDTDRGMQAARQVDGEWRNRKAGKRTGRQLVCLLDLPYAKLYKFAEKDFSTRVLVPEF